MTDKILSCGHAPSRHSEYTTGTAHTRDGREICWTCADREQVADLLKVSTYTAYLTLSKPYDGLGNVPPLAYERGRLTTWTGGLLARVTRAWTVRNNFAGKLWRFRARDVHGQEWYGTSPGPGMYARMHKAKNAK